MSRRWALVAAIAVGCGLIVAGVSANHALPIQVVAAATGAALTLGGTSIAVSMWPGRNDSELRRLLASLGFLAACIGVFTMGAGAGLFH